MSNQTTKSTKSTKRQHKRRYISSRIDAATREAERRIEIAEALEPYRAMAYLNARCN